MHDPTRHPLPALRCFALSLALAVASCAAKEEPVPLPPPDQDMILKLNAALEELPGRGVSPDDVATIEQYLRLAMHERRQGHERRAQELASQGIDEAQHYAADVIRSVPQLLVRLKAEGSLKSLYFLRQALEKHQEIVRRRPGEGFIFVGRITLEDMDLLDEVSSPVDLLPGGYYVGAAPNGGRRELAFALHRHETVRLTIPRSPDGQPIYIGESRLAPLTPEREAGVRGRLLMPEDVLHYQVDLRFGIRQSQPDSIRVRLKPDGSFAAGGFAPTRYWLSIELSGRPRRGKWVELEPGKILDLGVIEVE